MSDTAAAAEPAHPRRLLGRPLPKPAAILAGALVLGVLFGLALRVGTDLAQHRPGSGGVPAAVTTPGAHQSAARPTPSSPGAGSTPAVTNGSRAAGSSPAPAPTGVPAPSRKPRPSTAPTTSPPPSPTAAPSPSPTAPPTD